MGCRVKHVARDNRQRLERPPVLRQASDNGDWAWHTCRRPTARVDISLSRCLDMKANAWRAASLRPCVWASASVDRRVWDSSKTRWDSEFPTRAMRAAVSYALVRRSSVILHYRRRQ